MADADIRLIRDLDLGQSPSAVMQALVAETDWRQDSIVLFGRRLQQPRLTAWHSDPGAAYRYSGLRLEPLPWSPLLADLRARVEAAAGARFNAVLLNLYRDGQDSMGLHSDDEPELGPCPVIGSLSLGAERRMLFRHRTDRGIPNRRVPMPHGSLLVMGGPTQHHWHHGIEKQRAPCGMRLNLTFRLILPGF